MLSHELVVCIHQSASKFVYLSQTSTEGSSSRQVNVRVRVTVGSIARECDARDLLLLALCHNPGA